MPEKWPKTDSVWKIYSEEESAQVCKKKRIFRIFFGILSKDIDRFEVFDATKFQAAQNTLNTDSLRAREQRTAHIYKFTLDCCTELIVKKSIDFQTVFANISAAEKKFERDTHLLCLAPFHASKIA